ncbi:hypothetical protein KP509_21G051800 [Ceratopteris richardii]|nr:hypothetical protein KP509_21G051800 [Ceratopteris richardii]
MPNSTFQIDESVLRTGEDFSLSPADNVTVSMFEEAAITEVQTTSVFNAIQGDEKTADAPICSSQDTPINCSDPAVLNAIINYNLEHFPDLSFFSYYPAVKGPSDDQCDAAWKFRAKKEKSWRMYKDFRRFTLTVSEACNVSVVDAGGWHSGKYAKHLIPRKRGSRKSKRKFEAALASLEKNVTVMEEAEVIEDSVDKADVSTFQQHKYLFYARGGDHCKKMSHYLWSFLCALGEAQYLNRALVLDLNLCLSSSNNPGHADEDGKDFRFYFDFAHLKDSGAVIEQKAFLTEWEMWNQRHPKHQASFREVVGNSVTPMDLQQDTSTIIMRKFELPEPDNYWYRVCEGETENVVQRPWHLLWKSKRIMDVVNAICGQMEWDFDAIHVVRGEKARNKDLWPNLDSDTTPESLVAKLSDEIDTNRYLYIATDEREPGYFDAVKDTFKQARTLDDFSALWAEGSAWYNQTLELTGGIPVEFDGYMRAEVDTEVILRAKKKLETFGFLTKDCKDGISTC